MTQKVMKGSLGVSLSLNGNNILTRFTPTIEEVFGSFTELNTLISSASEGSTLDLNGVHYRPADISEADSFPNGILINKNITLENGTVSGTLDLNWSESTTAGIFYADIPVSTNGNITYDDPRVYLIDNAQTEQPYLQARRQDSRNAFKKYNALSKNNVWYNVLNSRAIDGNGDVISITAPDTEAEAEWDLYFNSGVSNTATLYRGISNLVYTVVNASYNSGTKTLTFQSPAVDASSTYMEVIFTGLDPHIYLEPGEYCFRNGEGRIYYRPVSGSASKARLPVMSKVIRLTGQNKTLTLDGCTLFGQLLGNDSADYLIGGGFNSLEVAAKLATRNGTIIRNCSTAFRSVTVDLQDSEFYDFITRGGAGVYSGQVLRNYFGNAANQSALFFSASSTTSPILIEDNIFAMPASTHGQPVSAYLDSWQNCTIRHNIFYNCERSHSFQPSSSTNGDINNLGTYLFANNLIYIDQLRDDPAISGQAGFAWNGVDATNLDGLAQVVTIQNNTFVASQALYDGSIADDNKSQQLVRLYLDNTQHLEVLTANNIMSSRMIPDTNEFAESSANTGHGSLCNGQWGTIPGLSTSLAQSDLLSAGFSGVLNVNTFEPQGTWSTAATDGGKLGIRWSSVPSASAIGSLTRTWAASYPADTIPSVSFPTNPDDLIVYGDDKRP